MIKSILVAAGGNAGDAASLAAALTVARGFAARIDVLHVRLDPAAVAIAMTGDVATGAVTPGIIVQLERDAQDRERRAHDGFSQFCAEAGLPLADGVSAEWHVETGDEPRWMTTYGVAADLIVAPRPPGDDGGERSTLEAVVVDTGRPVLIPAAAPMPGNFERIAIAWKPVPQAARAVAFAAPFLARAKEALVVTVEEQADSAEDAARLVRNLARHGLTAHAERLAPGPDGAAATLVSALAGRADLLVMGGYGHSRVREWVFGGFTQHILAGAPLPVLIAH